MKQAGRDLSAVQVDRPAQDGDAASDWLRHLGNKGSGIAQSDREKYRSN